MSTCGHGIRLLPPWQTGIGGCSLPADWAAAGGRAAPCRCPAATAVRVAPGPSPEGGGAVGPAAGGAAGAGGAPPSTRDSPKLLMAHPRLDPMPDVQLPAPAPPRHHAHVRRATEAVTLAGSVKPTAVNVVDQRH